MSKWVHAGIRAVVFDAVGTLIHTRPGAVEIYHTLAARQGVQLEELHVRQRFVAAYRAEEAIDQAAGWITSEQREHQRWRAIVTHTLAVLPDPGAAFQELFEHFASPSAWQVPDEAAGVLQALRDRGLILGMGTNYDSRVERVVAGLPQLTLLWGRLVVSAAIGFRKPGVEFFQKVVQFAGCSPREVLFVGDDLENDYEGAIAAGLEAVLLDPRGQSSAPRRIERLTDLL